MSDMVDTDVTAPKINPLLNKLRKSNLMPGTTFRLPSQGLLYNDGELSEDVVDGEIVIHPMSLLDEIYLKTPDMLFQGTGVELTIARCCPQILKPEKLLSKDVDFILTCMRMVSYGNEVITNFKCDCGAPEVKLSVSLNNFLKKSKSLEEIDKKGLTFVIDNFEIKARYGTFSEMLELTRNESMHKQDDSIKDAANFVYETLVHNIVVNIESIDGVSDKEYLFEFMSNTSRAFQTKILKKIQELNKWGVDFIVDHTCKKCKKTTAVEVSLNPVSFFTEL